MPHSPRLDEAHQGDRGSAGALGCHREPMLVRSFMQMTLGVRCLAKANIDFDYVFEQGLIRSRTGAKRLQCGLRGHARTYSGVVIIESTSGRGSGSYQEFGRLFI